MTKTYDLPSRRLRCEDSERLVAAHCRKTTKGTKKDMTKQRWAAPNALDRAISEVEPEALRLATGKRDLSRAERPLTKERLVLLNAMTEMRMIPVFMLEAVRILREVKTENYREAYTEICKHWKSVHMGRDYSESPVIYYSVLSLLRG